MKGGVNKNLKKLTIGALLSAIGVALLSIGGIIQTMDLSAAAIVSFICIFAVIEMGSSYAWMIYAVTGILGVIIMPHNMGAWFFLLFFGYYPILKEKMEKLSKPLSWTLKMILLNVALGIGLLLAAFVMYGGQKNFFELVNSIMETDFGIAATIGIILLVEVTFVIYDIALTRLITYYILRLRHRFSRFLK